MKKVSVIIPVYNAQKTLCRCLEALLAQTYSNFEVICVDDGSNDNSGQIIKEYNKKDKRIIHLFQINQGCAKARKYALEQAKGEYIMFCDADDWYEKEMIQNMVSAIEKYNTDIVICDTKVSILPQEGISDNYANYPKLFSQGVQKITKNTVKFVNVVLWNKIFKKELIDKYNITFPEKYEHNDMTFIFKYLCFAKTYYGLREPLYNYVIGNPNSIMGKVYACSNKNNKMDFIYIWQDFCDYLNKIQYNGELKKFFLNYIYSSIKYFYSFLPPPPDKSQNEAFLEIQKFIEKNPILQENKFLKKLKNARNFDEFNKIILYKNKMSLFLQRIFSIRNSVDKTHKIIYLLGFKIKFRKNI